MVGIESVSIESFKQKFTSSKLLAKVFSAEEIRICQKGVQTHASLAARWCAKLAVRDALRVMGKVESLSSIEILRNADGAPQVYVRSALSDIRVSLTHTDVQAMAAVLLS